MTKLLKHPRLEIVFPVSVADKVRDYNYSLRLNYGKHWTVEWVYHPDATSNIEVTYDFLGGCNIDDYLATGLPITHKFIWGFWNTDGVYCKTMADLLKAMHDDS